MGRDALKLGTRLTSLDWLDIANLQCPEAAKQVENISESGNGPL